MKYLSVGLIIIIALILSFTHSFQPAQAVSTTIVISQIYGGGGNSGATLRNDFIELFNRGNTPVDVTGWTVQYASASGNRWDSTVLAGVIQPGRYYLIQESQGNGGSQNLPTPNATGSLNMSATSGKVALVNNSSILSGSCPSEPSIVDFVGYGGSANCSEGSPTVNLTNTTAAIRISGGCTDTDSKSANFLATIPTPRNSSSAANLCLPVGPTVTPIRDIQGSSHTSPLVRQSVTTSGIVTVRRNNGFFLQTPASGIDSNPATSEAIFVFTSSAPAVTVGNAVTVSGIVAEFRPGGASSTNLTTTEISSPTINVQSSGNAPPAPVIIGTSGRVPPLTVIEDDAGGSVETSGVLDPATDGIDFYESLEAMRVQVNDAVAVGPRTDSGEIAVVGDNGANAGRRTTRGGLVIRQNDFNPERVILDNAISPTPQVNVGDRFTGAIIGVLDYSFGNFKLLVTSALSATSGGLSQETTTTAGSTQLVVATFNVENLDTGDAAAKFNTLASLIVNNLRSPDIIALEEIQDNNGAANDAVVDASTTYNTLIAAIQTAGGPTYQFRDISPADDQDGGEPGGNIRVGFLFRTDRGVSFIDRPGGDSTTAIAVINGAGGAQLSLSPGRIDPSNAAFSDSRKPLVGEFTFDGEKLFIIANHFVSKGGDDPLFGRFQPPMLDSETKRVQQAQAVNDFVNSILAINSNANIVVLGDLNDFEFSAPLSTLKGGVLNNLIETLPQSERYTYVFDGNSQALDHILVSNNLLNNFGIEYDVVHVNAEFAVRASDHDPQVARIGSGPDFRLTLNSATVNGERRTKVNMEVGINRLGGFTGNVTVSPPDVKALKIKVKPESKTTDDASVTFKLNIKGGAPVGAQQLVFTGKDDSGRERTVTLTLIIQ